MTTHQRPAVVSLAGDDLFIGTTPSGHGIAIDTNHERSSAPSPVELLMIALGSCTATDVVGILRKKREKVFDYRVEITGVRREEHPRAFIRMDVKHIVTGKNLSEKSVAQAVELSDIKYCSVAATFRPTVEIVSSYEIIEEDERNR